MINPIILQLFNTADQKMSGYASLLDYRYKNLCIKAEPLSLIPVEVDVEGTMFKMEDVADCTISAWNQIMVIPKDEDLIVYIGHAIMQVHPEFKQKVTRHYFEQIRKDIKVILLTMPPVDKDYRDVLNTGTDTLYDQCKIYIDKVQSEISVEITMRMAGHPKDEIDEARKKISDLHEHYCKQVDGLHDEKKKEIEDAYQKYLKEQGQDASSSDTGSPAQQPDAAFSMELPK